MSELIDLVDQNGTIVQRDVKRDDTAHYSNLYMQIVIVVLFNQEGILVHARSRKKQVSPGHVDHVCGGVGSGETPVEAAVREAYEETGLRPKNLSLITAGVNEYGRYRYLFVGEVEGIPTPDRNEIEWVDYIPASELHKRQKSGELAFVDGFFTDLDLAVGAQSVTSNPRDKLAHSL